MSPFEYLAVLVSLILGLGIAHILTGVGRAIHRRREIRTDLVHGLWTVTTFLILVLNWWVFFESRSVPTWTFGQFLLIIGWSVAFYLILLAGIGMVVRRRGYHVFLVGYVLCIGLLWAVSARGVLEG